MTVLQLDEVTIVARNRNIPERAALCHTKGTWAGKPFELIDWQEQIIRDLFGVLTPNGYRQFNTAYIAVSYTHLDVYKRQARGFVREKGEIKRVIDGGR